MLPDASILKAVADGGSVVAVICVVILFLRELRGNQSLIQTLTKNFQDATQTLTKESQTHVQSLTERSQAHVEKITDGFLEANKENAKVTHEHSQAIEGLKDAVRDLRDKLTGRPG